MLVWASQQCAAGEGGGVAEVAEVAEGVRIFAIGFRKLQACPPPLCLETANAYASVIAA